MNEAEDCYLSDETFDALVDRLSGPDDPAEQGWTKRDEVIWSLMDAGVWPARVGHLTQ